MQVSSEMQKAVDQLSKLDGFICYGLVNYQKGVSAVNEDSSPQDEANFFPQQCTAIIKQVFVSLGNLDGGYPDKLMVKASKMTMIIYIVNDTYFCGVGLMPGTPTEAAEVGLEDLRQAFRKQLG